MRIVGKFMQKVAEAQKNSIFYTVMTISLAGAVGALARYGLLWLLMQFSEHGFAWGVFIVNILGCFGFGVLWSLQKVRKILLIGFMGSFTTFSSYIYELYIFIQSSAWMQLFFNSFLQIILGFMALQLGFLLNTKLFR